MISGFFRHNRMQVRHAVRMTAACFISYVLGQALGLHQNQWAVLTSIIVMQASVGGSLKAMMDRLIGSLGGAIAGIVVVVGLHLLGIASPGAALALGLPPLTLLATLKPTYRVTPITFIILILTPNLQELGPVESAYQRMIEIAVGSAIALAVSLTILPARAHDTLAQAVSQALAAMAELMAALSKDLAGEDHVDTITATHARIRTAIAKAESAADEALRERASFLSDGVDPLPVCRTLRRLRHDIAILGRTMTVSLPQPVEGILLGPITNVLVAISEFLQRSAEATAKRALPPLVTALDTDFASHSQAVKVIRQQGLSRILPDDDLARIFGLGFALEQLHRDLVDLAERVAELADQPSAR